nr:acyl carrier protein [Streptomyces sp. DHE17-7]
MRERAAEVLGHPGTPVRPETALRDSIRLRPSGAVELRNQLNAATGLTLSATLVFDHPTPAPAGHSPALCRSGQRPGHSPPPQPATRNAPCAPPSPACPWTGCAPAASWTGCWNSPDRHRTHPAPTRTPRPWTTTPTACHRLWSRPWCRRALNATLTRAG